MSVLDEDLSIAAGVRRRPGMWFGSADGAFDQCIFEFVANGVDCFLRDEATRVDVVLDEDGAWVSDDGPGLPFELRAPGKTISLAESFLTEAHQSATADGHAPHIHFRFVGLGLAPVNAACSKLVISSWRDGRRWRQEFTNGRRLGPPRIAERGGGRGTGVHFIVDPALYGDADDPPAPRMAVLRRIFFDAVHLFPGLRLSLNEECFHAPGGLADLALFHAAQRVGRSSYASLPRPFHARVADDLVRLEVVVIAGESSEAPNILSWANGSSTMDHGVHVNGTLAALYRAGCKPAVVLVHAIMLKPAFAGPMKRELCTPGVAAAVERLLQPLIKEFLSFHHGDWPH